MRKTIDVWISRDGHDGEEPELVFMHAVKPELINGTWRTNTTCIEVPDVKSGKCKRVRLELD